jgi:hypothetical protein
MCEYWHHETMEFECLCEIADVEVVVMPNEWSLTENQNENENENELLQPL